MSRRDLPLLLGALAALANPAPGLAQLARVGAEPGPGGVVTGRVCVDLDRDGACSGDEPGIAGARVRFEDGRIAIADGDGRFHAVEVAARMLLADRSAFGAHALSADGLGVTRRFELGPRGAAAVELPVPLPAHEDGTATVASAATGGATVTGDRVLWPVEGTAPPGSRVEAAGQRTEARKDGGWTLSLALADGANAVGVAIAAPDGSATIWRLGYHVARPADGPVRVYSTRPLKLAALTVRPAGDGAAILGRMAPGVELRAGGAPVRPASDGRFGAWAPAVEGEVAVTAAEGGTAVALALPVAPGGAIHGLLLGELELQAGGRAGFLATGRLAGSASGRWRGFHMDAGIDLDDRDRRGLDLLAPRDPLAAALVPDPVRTFTVAGDGATLDDLNAGRGRLWARAEGRGLKLGIGSGRTGLAGAELGRHDRAFFGARAEGETAIGPARIGALLYGGRVDGDAGGLAPGTPCQDRFAATGGSLFYLRNRQVVAGSEIATVEWRDPLSRLPVARRELTRGHDYELDAARGRLLLARPLPSLAPMAALGSGEPFAAAEPWIVVDYLRVEPGEAGAGGRGVGGGELRAASGPVAVALGGAGESRPGADWRLVRGSASLDLGAPLRASLMVARSEGRLFGATLGGRVASLDGGFTFAEAPGASEKPATAFHADLRGDAGGASWRGWWRERPEGYSDGEFAESSAARERGALAQWGRGPLALRLLWAERRGADPLDPSGLARRDMGRAVASAAWEAGPVRLTVEGLHERLTLPESGAQSAAGARAEWRGSHGLTLDAGHMEAFEVSGSALAATFTSAGAALRTPEGRLGLRAGWGPALGPRVLLSGERGGEADSVYGTLSAAPATAGTTGAWQSDPLGGGSAVGGRQRVHGATLFTEERLSRDPMGLVSGRVVGASLRPREGLAVSLSGERGERLRLDGTTAARAAGGLSAAWLAGPVRLDGRTELRKEGKGQQWLAGAGVEWAAAARLTLALRATLADGEISGLEARTGEGWLSAAWRSDAISVLGRIGRVLDDREGVIERDATIAAVALAARVLGRARLGLGLEVAGQRIDGVTDDRAAGSARAEVAIYGPFDVAVEYARRGSLEGRALGDLDALRAEAGFTASDVRLSLGYTVAGFQGNGIEPEAEDGRVYLRVVLVR